MVVSRKNSSVISVFEDESLHMLYTNIINDSICDNKFVVYTSKDTSITSDGVNKQKGKKGIINDFKANIYNEKQHNYSNLAIILDLDFDKILEIPDYNRFKNLDCFHYINRYCFENFFSDFSYLIGEFECITNSNFIQIEKKIKMSEWKIKLAAMYKSILPSIIALRKIGVKCDIINNNLKLDFKEETIFTELADNNSLTKAIKTLNGSKKRYFIELRKEYEKKIENMCQNDDDVFKLIPGKLLIKHINEYYKISIGKLFECKNRKVISNDVLTEGHKECLIRPGVYCHKNVFIKRFARTHSFINSNFSDIIEYLKSRMMN
jgi:hypothetical protein